MVQFKFSTLLVLAAACVRGLQATDVPEDFAHDLQIAAIRDSMKAPGTDEFLKNCTQCGFVKLLPYYEKPTKGPTGNWTIGWSHRCKKYQCLEFKKKIPLRPKDADTILAEDCEKVKSALKDKFETDTLRDYQLAILKNAAPVFGLDRMQTLIDRLLSDCPIKKDITIAEELFDLCYLNGKAVQQLRTYVRLLLQLISK